jgi:hypothetical protein
VGPPRAADVKENGMQGARSAAQGFATGVRISRVPTLISARRAHTEIIRHALE